MASQLLLNIKNRLIMIRYISCRCVHLLVRQVVRLFEDTRFISDQFIVLGLISCLWLWLWLCKLLH